MKKIRAIALLLCTISMIACGCGKRQVAVEVISGAEAEDTSVLEKEPGVTEEASALEKEPSVTEEKTIEDKQDEGMQAEEKPAAINNGNYFVKIGDRVYFREYGTRALQSPTLWGEFLISPTGDHSYMDYYDEATGQAVQAFEDFGYGKIVYMNGSFFLNGLDFSEESYGVPYIYAVDEEGSEVPLPKRYHGTIKGVSAANDMLICLDSSYRDGFRSVISGISQDGQQAFAIESENDFHYIGIQDDYLLYAEMFYATEDRPKAKVWCKNLYRDDVVLITEVTCEVGEFLAFGEPFTSNGTYYIQVIERAGSANMFQVGCAITYTPGVADSGQRAAEFYADEFDDTPLVMIDGVERRFEDHEGSNYFIKQKAFEDDGDLYLRMRDGEEILKVKGLIPGADYYGIRKHLCQAESVDETGYVMLATMIFDESGSIGWRDGFRLLNMEYLYVADDGTYQIIQNVQYE